MEDDEEDENLGGVSRTSVLGEWRVYRRWGEKEAEMLKGKKKRNGNIC